MTSKHGPNVTKLILRFVAKEAIPAGGGIADGIKFFTGSPQYRKKLLDQAEADAMNAIDIVIHAPDNPYGNDPEEIAKAILDKLEERKSKWTKNS
jgi:hypothetical protein